MFDTGNNGNAVQQLLKQFVIVKVNKILVSLEVAYNATIQDRDHGKNLNPHPVITFLKK